MIKWVSKLIPDIIHYQLILMQKKSTLKDFPINQTSPEWSATDVDQLKGRILRQDITEPTVKKKLESMLVSNGMFQKDAEKVIEQAIPKLNELASDYKITFDRPSDEYPNVIYHFLYMVVKPIALEWIDKNRPYAWFREMFVEQIEPKKY